MAVIKPFRGLIYNKEKIHNHSKVICPPYDTISPQDQDKYYRMHEDNIVRIIFGKENSSDSDKDNKYLRAGLHLNSWISEYILTEEKDPAVYIYEQQFVYEEKHFIRRGFIALIKLEDNKTIRFHENTYQKPKEDRLALLKATKTNTELIFSLYEGHFADALEGETIFETTDENGMTHRLIRVADEKKIAHLTDSMKDRKIYIADGHHRFETAVDYARELNLSPTSDAPQNYLMMCFVSTSDSGLKVLPIHRAISLLDEDIDYIIKAARRYFLMVEIDSFEKIKKAVGQVYGFTSRKDGKLYMLKLRDTSSKMKIMKEKGREHLALIDAAVLHALLLDDIFEKYKNKKAEEYITYTHDAQEAISLVKKGQRSAAFLLNPVRVSKIIEVADLGERMPQKSTFFYPKLYSGIIMRKMD